MGWACPPAEFSWLVMLHIVRTCVYAPLEIGASAGGASPGRRPPPFDCRYCGSLGPGMVVT
jgi:hypothetical protein